MRLMDTKRDLSSGGGNFFRIGEGQTGKARFLYNTIDDIMQEGLLVHVIKPEISGQKYNTEILCGAKSDETATQDCKWCAQNIKPVGRFPLALYNENTRQVEYWSKSKQWVENSLYPILEKVIKQGQPISGQSFMIIRAGSGTDTQYNLLPDGENDGRKADTFGDIKVPEERNCYRQSDYEFPVSSNGGANFNAGNNYGNNYGNNNYNYGNSNFQSNRRTTDVF